MESNKPKLTPKDFFLYFGALISLIISASTLLTILFTIINKIYPDSLDYVGYGTATVYSAGLRFAIASLIIFFPTYLILSFFISKGVELQPEKRMLGLRRWLSYFMLFVTGATALGDLVTLIYNFLDGEISIRFLLKIVVVLIIAGGIFAHYSVELRASVGFLRRFKWFALITGIVVLVSLIVSFAILGTPQSQREARFDDQRISDLQNIQSEVINYYQSKGSVPVSLADLDNELSYTTVPQDPETSTAYQYIKVSTTSFKLCADFGTAPTMVSPAIPQSPYGATDINDNWQHGKGTTCFTRTIDPDMNPVYNGTSTNR